MTGTVRLAFAEAYKIKAECGGGFRGLAQNMITKEVAKGVARETLEEARNDAKAFVWAWAADRNMTTGTYRNPKGSWKMNYYIRADEA